MSILIQNVTAVLLDEGRTVLPNAFVTVEGSQISYVGTKRPAGPFDRVIDGAGKVLMPGFVNAHTHVPMTLMRGYGGGHDLQTWLNDYIFPVEAKLDSRAVRAGTALSLAEAIAGGVTEPALFGILMRFRRTMFGMFIGGAIGAVFSGLMGVTYYLAGGASNFLVFTNYLQAVSYTHLTLPTNSRV